MSVKIVVATVEGTKETPIDKLKKFITEAEARVLVSAYPSKAKSIIFTIVCNPDDPGLLPIMNFINARAELTSLDITINITTKENASTIQLFECISFTDDAMEAKITYPNIHQVFRMTPSINLHYLPLGYTYDMPIDWGRS